MIKFFDKKFSEIGHTELEPLLKDGHILICHSSDKFGGMRYSVFVYEIFPRSYNEALLGGGDFAFKAHTASIQIANYLAEYLTKQDTPHSNLRNQERTGG